MGAVTAFLVKPELEPELDNNYFLELEPENNDLPESEPGSRTNCLAEQEPILRILPEVRTRIGAKFKFALESKLD